MLQVEANIEALQAEIDRLLQPYRMEIDLLITIPGIQGDAAASILAQGDVANQFKITLFNHFGSYIACAWSQIE
jgi:transposase